MKFAMMVAWSVCLGAMGCGAGRTGDAPSGGSPAPRTVTILAPDSTRDALNEIINHPQLNAMDIRVSYGGTNQLASQILEGAPADLFLSASESWMQHVVDAGFVARIAALLSNRLVIIVPRRNNAVVNAPNELLRREVTRVALAGEHVPAVQYAEQALRALNLLEALSVTGRIVRGNDVRAVLNFVARGEVEAGIVYETDAAVSGEVEIVHWFDPSLHAPIVYPIALLIPASSNEAALAVWEHLRSPVSEAVWVKHGFVRIRRVRAERTRCLPGCPQPRNGQPSG